MAGKFTRRILVLGAGSVSQCSVPLLIDKVVLNPNQITVLDFLDNKHRYVQPLKAGINYLIDRITQENMSSKLSEHVSAGDVLLDLAWNIDANAIIGWCHDNQVMYLNTSVEEWDPYDDQTDKDPREKTLLVRHAKLKKLTDTWATPGATAVIEHGANPGLVSHFVKQALSEIAERGLKEGKFTANKSQIETALADETYNHLSHQLGVKVIHVSERDTQITDKPKQVGEFVNTWSVAGFHEEGIAPAELGWGTHEKTLPAKAYRHQDSETQICIAQPGATLWVRSWVPNYEINGMVVRHGEAYTIPKHLTVKDDSGKEIYRPTVHYAYCPSDAGIASMRELEANNWEFPTRERIMNDEILSGGDDRLGVLLMGHPYSAWWTGSLLTIDEARSLVPSQSATTMQVAASVVACTLWMIDNPDRGVCVPDDLPWRTILNHAKPYLGKFHSDAVDWNPLKNRNDLFGKWDGTVVDPDPWQFSNFLVNR